LTNNEEDTYATRTTQATAEVIKSNQIKSNLLMQKGPLATNNVNINTV